MIKLYFPLLYILSFFIFQNESYAQSDGLLKNGRSVRYTLFKGQWQRELESEENDFVQVCIAKALNSFQSVKIDGYQRSGRFSPDAEDILRNRKDDLNSVPYHLKGILSYKNDQQQEIFIEIDVNPAQLQISGSEIQSIQNENFTDLWEVKNYTKTTITGQKYQGSAYIFSIGNFTQKLTSKQLQIQGDLKSKSFLQTNHIVIKILAEKSIAQQILETLDKERLQKALLFDEYWP